MLHNLLIVTFLVVIRYALRPYLFTRRRITVGMFRSRACPRLERVASGIIAPEIACNCVAEVAEKHYARIALAKSYRGSQPLYSKKP